MIRLLKSIATVTATAAAFSFVAGAAFPGPALKVAAWLDRASDAALGLGVLIDGPALVLGAVYIAKRKGWRPIDAIRSTLRIFFDHEQGSIAVEAAIILPVFFLALGIGIDCGLATVADYKLVYGTSQAGISMASGGDPQGTFAGNSGGSVTCSTDGSNVTCDGQNNYAVIFAGLLNISTIPLTAHSVAAIQKTVATP